MGGPAVFSFATPSNYRIYKAAFPQTDMLLPAGDYRVAGRNLIDWGTGNSQNIITDSVQFSLTVVPAPGSVAVVAMIGGMRVRRRRSE